MDSRIPGGRVPPLMISALLVALVGELGGITAAKADCVATGPTTYQCFGSNLAGQTINVPNATVSTISGYNSPAAGLEISSSGTLSFTDSHASTLTASGSGDALAVISSGAGPGTNAINIATSGNISGGGTGNGIVAANGGGGANSVTATGLVTGGVAGILAVNGQLALPATPIINVNLPSTGTDLTVSAASVTGGSYGIYATNLGTGATSVSASGTVTSYGAAVSNGLDAGIAVTNGSLFQGAGTNITVNANVVEGVTRGIDIANYGTGFTHVTATGAVNTASVVNGIGISVVTQNSVTGGIEVNATSVTGATGISVYNGVSFSNTLGAVSITATGPVTGSWLVAGSDYGVGINAVNSGTDLTINAQAVTGGSYAVFAQNNGSGVTSVTTNGTVTGTNPAVTSTAIYVTNATNSGDLTVIANGDVIAATNGIQAIGQSATGNISITTNGVINATGGVGISGQLGFGSQGDVTIVANKDVTAETVGISSQGATTGTAKITSYGVITATGPQSIGIAALDMGNVIVDAKNTVSGVQNGISAGSAAGVFGGGGVGTVNVIAEKDVSALGPSSAGPVATSTAGILVLAESSVSSMNVTTGGKVTGTDAGISVFSLVNQQAGLATITVNSGSLVQGGTQGILLETYDTGPPVAQSAVINNAGTIQNLSTASDALAIASLGNFSTTIVNSGLVLGTVNLVDPGNSFDNKSGGVWNTAGGTNDFGTDTANNRITNEAGGTIIAAGTGASAPVTTTFNGLGTFANAGLIVMQNGVVGDRAVITGNYVGQGGTISLDTHLGSDGSPSDRLVLNGGVATGNTLLDTHNTDGPGTHPVANGIEVVQANNGATTAPGAFTLSHPVITGAWQYMLYRGGPDPTGAAGDGGDVAQNWYLRNTLQPSQPSAPSASPEPSYPSYRQEVPVYLAAAEFANQLGFASIDNLDARSGEDLALPSPAEQTVWCKDPARRDRCEVPGHGRRADEANRYVVWGRLLAYTGEQEPGGGNRQLSSSNPFLLDFGPQYSYTIGGMQAGVDLLHRDYLNGARDRAGFYVSDIQGWGTVQQVYEGVHSAPTAGKINLNAAGLGAYWTHYGPSGWYTDAVLQGTWYDQVGGTGSTTGMTVDGYGMAASLEVGEAFRLTQNWMVTPQAQAIYQHTHLGGGVDDFGYTSFGDTDDVRARIGAKLSTIINLATGSSGPMPLTFSARFNLWHDFLIKRPRPPFRRLLSPIR